MTTESEHTKDLVEKIQYIASTLGHRNQRREAAGSDLQSGAYNTTDYRYQEGKLVATYSITSFSKGLEGAIGSSTKVEHEDKVVLHAIEDSRTIQVYIPGPWEKKIERAYKKIKAR